MATTLISPNGQDNLDIDKIKIAFKQYLIDNDVITDINYQGSNISILVDIISYAIQNVNATHALLSNETILPLSSIRQNIIQIAKQLGYNITRTISSKQSITVDYPLTIGQTITIPKKSEFSVGDFTFYNDSDILLTYNSPSVTFDIIEGVNIDSTIDPSLLFDLTVGSDRFVLPYKNIENNSVKMYVQYIGSTIWTETWTKVDSLLKLETGKNYFYEDYDVDTGWVNIITSFAGNGTSFKIGDKIKFEFIQSNGTQANRLSACSLTTKLNDNNNLPVDVNIIVNSASRSGQDEESNDSVKTNAPLFYNAGNRVVNEVDYNSLLEQSSLVNTAMAWGGESHIPQKLGHIFFSVIPQDTNKRYLDNLEEAELLNLLTSKRITSTVRVFWHPSYIDVDVQIKLLGDIPDVLTKQSTITNNITNYFIDDLSKFNVSLYESKIINIIEDVFVINKDASTFVEITPKLLITQEMFINNKNDLGQLMIFIPNSSKRYYLTKGDDRISMPDNNEDVISYYINGWIRTYEADSDLDITFDAVLNGLNITTGAAYLDSNDDINKKDIFYDITKIGYFDIDNSILYIDGSFSNSFTDSFSLNMNYNPYFNVKLLHNSYIRLGNITYV
ncbi:MAG: hypothetical protein QM489_03965 [Candidatus Izemoplasma sp.]